MKHNIIYIDPPFSFANWSDKKHGSPKPHYNVLKNEDIKNLPIGDIADKNCAMLLWIPSVKIAEGFHVDLFESWGFRPVSICFVWNKTFKNGNKYMGLGFWSRNDCEFCLLGIKGKMKRMSTTVVQTITAPRLLHSAKPPIVREKIVQLFGDLPRIELFSRIPKRQDNGWVHVGYEVDGSDIRDALKLVIGGKYGSI